MSESTKSVERPHT